MFLHQLVHSGKRAVSFWKCGPLAAFPLVYFCVPVFIRIFDFCNGLISNYLMLGNASQTVTDI